MKINQSDSFKLDWKIGVLTVVSTLLLIVDHYYKLTPWKYLDRTILYLIIPMAIVIVVFREKPGNYGFCLGNWRLGLILFLGSIILIAPILWVVTHGNSGMNDYYQDQLKGLPWTTFVDLLGWEFIFRGWLLFGYVRKFGPEGLWLQAVPFALAHIGKPDVETLSTIFGGFAFGWVAWQTKSFIYPFLIHWFVSTFTIVVASGLLG